MGKEIKNYKIDRISFVMGMINCFVEMVANGVKKLALSPPINPEDHNIICSLAEKIVTGFSINSYLEKSLLITDLQTEDFTKEKWSILYYDKDEVLDKYFELKKKKQMLQDSGKYDKKARQNLSAEFMRLLSYPEEKINKILARENPESPYMLDAGIIIKD
jgi:hypothetical protein